MRTTMKLAILTVLALLLGGCGGGTSDSPTPEAAAPDSAPVETPADSSTVENDLTRQWGPDVMPDQVTQPLEFLYWRVDRLYEDKDLDGDGQLTLEEFGGITANFERIDTNDDGLVIKKEIIDDMTLRMREQGTIP